MNAISTQIDDMVNGDLKSGGNKVAPATIDESTNEERDKENLVNENLPGEDVKDTTASSTRLKETLALGGEKAPFDVAESGDTNGEQSTLSGDGMSKDLCDISTRSDVEVSTKQGGEPRTPEPSEETGQEPHPDEDDGDDEDGSRYSDIFEEAVVENVEASVRPKRYELSYWSYHLASAEKLWTPEEREKSDEWKELWKLVILFLCESPDAFKVWQQHYMELDYEYEAYNVPLSPLSVAAAYGLPGLVKILLDRGELAAAETEDGRSALWFGAISPDIEIITLLLEKGASPNARKDFPPPFHNLLRGNPKLDVVNLMLEHGADCNITDEWGYNALHWFAACGSDVEVLKAILKAHNDINIPDANGETPLHLAMYNDHGLSLDLLRVLLENGADVNKDDKDSQSKSP